MPATVCNVLHVTLYTVHLTPGIYSTIIARGRSSKLYAVHPQPRRLELHWLFWLAVTFLASNAARRCGYSTSEERGRQISIEELVIWWMSYSYSTYIEEHKGLHSTHVWDGLHYPYRCLQSDEDEIDGQMPKDSRRVSPRISVRIGGLPVGLSSPPLYGKFKGKKKAGWRCLMVGWSAFPHQCRKEDSIPLIKLCKQAGYTLLAALHISVLMN